MNTKPISISAKALKKYIHKRNEIVKVIQALELTKTAYISSSYDDYNDYGHSTNEKEITFDIEFNKAAHAADTILQQMGMNKPNYLKSIEGEYYHLESYVSNRSSK